MQPIDPTQTRFKQIKIGIFFIAGILVLWLAFSLYNTLRFRIVSTNPATSSVATNTPFFKITFNKTLSSQNLNVTGTTGVINAYSTSGKTLTIKLNYPMSVSKTYGVTVVSVQSQSGSQMHNKTFTFTPQNIPVNKLPADQQNALIGNQDQFTGARKDPILAHLPYSTLDFSLTPTFTTDTAGQQQLVLQAQLLLAPGVSGGEADADAAQYKQEVSDYIQSLGLNPTNYTIQYQTVNETLNGP